MKGMHGIIFSYGKRTELRELITHRIHGSIPFACDYRVVDFMLSNMVNAGITDVGVIMHGKCQSLLDHLRSGKSWDLSRNHGGLTLLPTFAYNEKRSDGEGLFRGKVEALGCVMDYLEHIRQDYVVLSDSDMVINLPLQKVLDEHIRTGADITCVCTEQPGESTNTYIKLDDTGRICDVAFDLNHPSGYRCLNIFVLSKEFLINTVKDCVAHNRFSFRRHILQEMYADHNFRAYLWDGYAARINSVAAYYEQSMQLLDAEVRAELFLPERPIFAKENDAASTYIDPTGECVNSLIADGCDIQGSVKNCVVFRGVTVEKGATVENSILFKGTTVKAGAMLRCVIADKNVVFNENVTLMGHEKYPVVVAKDTEV